MDYKELIESLRFMATHGRRYGMAVVVMDNAADAIEELQQDNADLNGTVANLIEQIKDLAQPRWISVKNALPESRQSCLCYNVGGAFGQLSWVDIQTYYYDEDFNIGGWHKPTMYGELVGEVAYWMPLPPPPKEDEA